MVAQSRTLASAGPRLASATRSHTGDPARAGALRLAILAALIALGAGAVVLLATRQVLEHGSLTQLETVRAAVEGDVARFTRELGDATAEIATDPRLAAYLRELREPQRKGAGAPRPPRWLAVTAQRYGWTDVLLFQDGADRAVYATGAAPDVQPGVGLGLVLQRAESRSGPGVALADAGPDPAFGGKPMLYAAASVMDDATRVGTLVVAVGTAALETSLRGTSGQTVPFGLGESGSVWLFDEAGRLRSSLGAPASPPVEEGGASPDVAQQPLETALDGRDSAGRFATESGGAIVAYAPVVVGGARWAVGVQVPEGAAMAPLRRVALNVVAATLLAAVVGWLVGGRLWNQFAGRLRELATVVARVQRGDRQARIEVKRDGPVGELAAAINRLLDERASALARVEQDAQRSSRDAESLLRVVQEVSNGNFAPRAQIEDGTLGNVSRALNEMLDGIGTLVGSLQDVSGRVGESASLLRGCTDQVSSTATTQTRECGSLQNVAQTLRAGNQDIASQCAAAIEVARRTEQASKLGQSALADLISGMDGLQRETRAATVKIKRLGERSMQISAITGTISKMSAQTDMLALNAAIEASRAGEHGQGFTVVAEEVRKLAERAAAATKEVERLIAGIQSDVNEAVSGMERQAERLEVQTAAASQAEHALERVGAVTNESTTMLDQISGAASAQLDRAAEIETALKRLAESAKTVQQSSEQARRTTAQLLSVSEELGGKAAKLQA